MRATNLLLHHQRKCGELRLNTDAALTKTVVGNGTAGIGAERGTEIDTATIGTKSTAAGVVRGTPPEIGTWITSETGDIVPSHPEERGTETAATDLIWIVLGKSEMTRDIGTGEWTETTGIEVETGIGTGIVQSTEEVKNVCSKIVYSVCTLKLIFF